MRNIAFDELQTWCRGNGYALEDWRPSLPSATRYLELGIPSEGQALSEFLDDLVRIDRSDAEYLVWIRDWTIWNERSQEIGLAHLALLVDAAEVASSNQRSHAYLLTPLEWRETIALLTVPAMYGWDAHLFFQSGAALVDLSHEGRITVATRTADLKGLDAWAKTQP